MENENKLGEPSWDELHKAMDKLYEVLESNTMKKISKVINVNKLSTKAFLG